MSGNVLDYQTDAAEDRYGEVMQEAHRLRVQRDARRILAAEDRPPMRKPEVLTLRERLERPRQAVQWRIPSWQPANSRVMLAAQFKAGKTTLIGNLVRCLVDGAWFLDVYETTAIEGTVVVLDFEMGENQLDGWYADQGIKNDEQVIIVPLRGSAASFDILDLGVRAQWAQMLKDRGCAYLVVDCLRPILDALGLDEHREAGRFLTALDALLIEAGIGEAAIVHHMGHTAERSRGDSRIRDWPDVEWSLVRQDDDPSSPRYMSAYGRDVDVTESMLNYDPDTRRLSLVGGSRKEAAARDALTDVLKLLAKEDELSGRQIEEKLAGEHTQKPIRAGVKLGIREGSIVTKPGPKRSILHSCASVRQSASPPLDAQGVSERVSASVRIGDAHTLRTQTTLEIVPEPEPVRQDCSGCGQQLMHPKSIERGTCFRCHTEELTSEQSLG